MEEAVPQCRVQWRADLLECPMDPDLQQSHVYGQ